METPDKTARQFYEELRARPTRPRFGFGRRAAVVNVDLQKAFTAVGEFPNAYGTGPSLVDAVNRLAGLARSRELPVVGTYCAYLPSGEDAGVWGSRFTAPGAFPTITHGSRGAELDDRLDVDRTRDVVMNKRMASAFHETHLASLLTRHGIDTVIVTGVSTSGCVRATVVDSVSHGFRTIVPEEGVWDRHEIPHFANLYDMSVKYADVLPVGDVVEYLRKPAHD